MLYLSCVSMLSGKVTYIWPATHEPLKSPFKIIGELVNIFEQY
jgi:hypothetical protein